MIDDSDEETLAKQVASYMIDHDEVARSLGIKLDDIKPGFAKMSLEITGNMLNGLGIGHGGITYTLADTAFASVSYTHLDVYKRQFDACGKLIVVIHKTLKLQQIDCRQFHSSFGILLPLRSQ